MEAEKTGVGMRPELTQREGDANDTWERGEPKKTREAMHEGKMNRERGAACLCARPRCNEITAVYLSNLPRTFGISAKENCDFGM